MIALGSDYYYICPRSLYFSFVSLNYPFYYLSLLLSLPYNNHYLLRILISNSPVSIIGIDIANKILTLASIKRLPYHTTAEKEQHKSRNTNGRNGSRRKTQTNVFHSGHRGWRSADLFGIISTDLLLFWRRFNGVLTSKANLRGLGGSRDGRGVFC